MNSLKIDTYCIKKITFFTVTDVLIRSNLPIDEAITICGNLNTEFGDAYTSYIIEKE